MTSPQEPPLDIPTRDKFERPNDYFTTLAELVILENARQAHPDKADEISQKMAELVDRVSQGNSDSNRRKSDDDDDDTTLVGGADRDGDLEDKWGESTGSNRRGRGTGEGSQANDAKGDGKQDLKKLAYAVGYAAAYIVKKILQAIAALAKMAFKAIRGLMGEKAEDRNSAASEKRDRGPARSAPRRRESVSSDVENSTRERAGERQKPRSAMEVIRNLSYEDQFNVALAADLLMKTRDDLGAYNADGQLSVIQDLIQNKAMPSQDDIAVHSSDEFPNHETQQYERTDSFRGSVTDGALFGTSQVWSGAIVGPLEPINSPHAQDSSQGIYSAFPAGNMSQYATLNSPGLVQNRSSSNVHHSAYNVPMPHVNSATQPQSHNHGP